MIDKQFYRIEEILVNLENVDTVKMLLEGNAGLKTDRKYQKSKFIPRKPTWVNTNTRINTYVSNQGDALYNRTETDRDWETF